MHKHTPTFHDMMARVIVIESLIPEINRDLSKINLGNGHRSYAYAFLEKHRFSLCQERIRLEQAIAKVEAQS